MGSFSNDLLRGALMSIPGDAPLSGNTPIPPLPPPTLATETPVFKMNAIQQQTFHQLSQSFAQIIEAYKKLSQFISKAMDS